MIQVERASHTDIGFSRGYRLLAAYGIFVTSMVNLVVDGALLDELVQSTAVPRQSQ